MSVSSNNMSFSFELEISQSFIYSSEFSTYQHSFAQQFFSSQLSSSSMIFQNLAVSQIIQFQTMPQNFNQQQSFEILSIQYDVNDLEKNIKFLKEFIDIDKAFHISCTILRSIENERIESVKLHKKWCRRIRNSIWTSLSQHWLNS